MSADTLRDCSDPFIGLDDLSGLVVGLVLWLAIIVAAPVVVLVLAAGLFSIELPVVLALALGAVRLVVRFT